MFKNDCKIRLLKNEAELLEIRSKTWFTRGLCLRISLRSIQRTPFLEHDLQKPDPDDLQDEFLHQIIKSFRKFLFYGGDCCWLLLQLSIEIQFPLPLVNSNSNSNAPLIAKLLLESSICCRWIWDCLALKLNSKKLHSKGSGCGSVGRVVSSEIKGLRFKAWHQENFIYPLYI